MTTTLNLKHSTLPGTSFTWESVAKWAGIGASQDEPSKRQRPKVATNHMVNFSDLHGGESFQTNRDGCTNSYVKLSSPAEIAEGGRQHLRTVNAVVFRSGLPVMFEDNETVIRSDRRATHELIRLHREYRTRMGVLNTLQQHPGMAVLIYVEYPDNKMVA